MITIKKLQFIALWFHIPMWVVVAFCITLNGAYSAGLKEHNMKVAQKEAVSTAITNFLAEQPLKVLTNIRMDSMPTRDL